MRPGDAEGHARGRWDLVRGAPIGGRREHDPVDLRSPALPADAHVRLGSPHTNRANDALNEYIQHVGSAVFAVPPGVRDSGDWWGRTLFSKEA